MTGTQEHIVLVRHQSPLRAVGEAEALVALPNAAKSLPRRDFEIDTRPFADDIAGEHWDASEAYLQQKAGELRVLADELGSARIAYFGGMPEVAHAIALGAYFGDERRIELYDYDRDRDTWLWSSDEQTFSAVATNLPKEPVAQSGEVIIRIEISYPIADDDVRDAVGRESLADIRVRPEDGRDPAPGIIRSPDDVLAVRKAFRTALAAVAEARPNAELIHLFVAAPVSVCFAIGQELRLRNGRDVQTYRYRPVDGDNAYRPALLLTAEGQRVASRPLTSDDISLAADLREIWAEALEDVVQHALGLQEDAGGTVDDWYTSLRPADVLGLVKPFGGLRPLWEMAKKGDSLSREPRAEDYEFSKEARSWQVSDALVLGMYHAAGEDPAVTRELVRLFFYHEYLHDWQDLTKYTAENVGGFANSLERIDYMADSYAILHQLDFVLQHDRGRVDSSDNRQRFLIEQIALALRSFWAFEPPPPVYEWQERRLRRYLNWYWRRVQMREASSFEHALRVLSRQPSIEIAGLRYSSRRGRHYVRLDEVQPGTILEVGLVLEDGRFFRRGSTADLSNEEAMLAFANHKTEEIDRYFNGLFEHVRQTGGALPPE